MIKLVRNCLLVAGLTFALSALADAPTSLNLPDTHSDMSKGKISLYRAQIKEYKFGKNSDITNNEIFVTLDSTGDKVFTLGLHDDPSTNTVIADTLREAYLHDMTVTIYSSKFVKEGGAARIHAVQLERSK